MKISGNRISFACLLTLLVVVYSSCRPKSGSEDVAVAKVMDKVLYLSEISHIFPDKVSKADSVALANSYIETWIKTQLLVNKATMNLSQEELDLSRQIENYRSSLLIHKYEEQMLKSKLDTLVKEQELQAYYDQNANNFLLDETFVKAVYLKIPKTAPDISSVKKWYKSDKIDDIKKLDAYGYRHAAKYDYFNDNWVSFNQVENLLPKLIENEDEFLEKSKTIEQEDDKFIYLVYLRAKDTRGSISQYIFVRSKIRDIIINKRRVKYIADLENNIYNDAQDHGQVEIYKLDKSKK